MMRLLFIAALLLGVAPVTATAAQERPGGAEAAPGGQMPLSRVLKELAQRHKGKQLNTTMGQVGGKPVYLVQWQFPSGQIVVITVDAQSGQVLGQ
jgi:uncharacterized membrane protein YkoI